MKTQFVNYVEIKRVTWTKDSHGLFDYESKSVDFKKNNIETSSKVYKDESNLSFKSVKKDESIQDLEDPNYIFSLIASDRNEKFTLVPPPLTQYDSNKQNLFLIVRSLKNDHGIQRGYTLQLGDILRLGRIEYKVIEYQDHNRNRFSLYDSLDTDASIANDLTVKKISLDPNEKHQCRICLMDEHDSQDLLINPCKCKGTSEYVHITCLQSWINSKVKHKVSEESSCIYWKHLKCEICKTFLPDMVEIAGPAPVRVPIMAIARPETPYLLVERIFYDRTKEADNSKMLILLSIMNETHQIRLGRGHDCDLRENDISVSRLHAFIKYEDNKFVIVDNNSKFGTLILLRKEFEIEKKKIALQLGRTVVTFSLKQMQSKHEEHVNPMVVEKKANLKVQAELKNFDMNDFNMNGMGEEFGGIEYEEDK